MVAKTKQQLKSLESEAVRIEFPEEIYNSIYDFLIDIGAGNLLPDGDKNIKEYITKWHETFIHSNLYPDQIPFTEVYKKFFTAVITGAADRKGNNIAAMIECFNHWFQISGGKTKIFPEYFQTKSYSPNYRPEPSMPDDISKWKDEDIISQYEGIQKIYGTDFEKSIITLARKQGKSYFAKIVHEYKKRQLKPNN